MSLCVLVVDDEVHIRKILALKLGQRGAEVHEARDGLEALALLEGGLEPDVIVLDIMMPNLDGMTLLARLREDTRWSRLPVVMLSAVREPVDIAKVEALGVAAYVHKPFQTAALCETIERAAAAS